MVFEGRGRQPRSNSVDVPHRHCGVAALGRAAPAPDVGGHKILCAKDFVRRAHHSTSTNRRGGLS